MFGLDKMFDFNGNGQLDSWERAAQFQFMDEMMKDDEKSIFDDDDEIDAFADAGLDYAELEFMDPDEFDFYQEGSTNEVKYRNENGAYGAKTSGTCK